MGVRMMRKMEKAKFLLVSMLSSCYFSFMCRHFIYF